MLSMVPQVPEQDKSSSHTTCCPVKSTEHLGADMFRLLICSDYCGSTAKKSVCQYVCLGETPPQLNLLDFVNHCSKQCFSKPPSTVFISKLKKKLEEFSAVGACPWELQFFI